MPPGHCFRQEKGNHLPRMTGRSRFGEEKPGVGSIAGARTFDGNWEARFPTCLRKCGDIVFPSGFVEVCRHEPADVTGQQRVHADGVLARQMTEQGMIIQRQERLVRTFRAPSFRLTAETVDPFVSTSWRVTRLVRLGIFPPSREDVGTTTEVLPEDTDFPCGFPRRCGLGHWGYVGANRSDICQRLSQGHNLRARLGLGAGQAFEFRLGFVDCLGEKILLIGSFQAARSYMEDVARGTAM